MHTTATPLTFPTAPDAPVERSFVTSDGVELFYRHWGAAGATHALVLLHRGHEHSGRLAGLVSDLAPAGCHAFAWDARGHGRSPGARGHAPSFSRLVRDLHEFVREIERAHGIQTRNVILLGHSVGAVIAAAWVHDYAPPIRAMVLATPAFRVRLYVPLTIPSLRALLRVNPRATIRSYVKGRLLTHDSAEASAYDGDPLVSRTIAVNVLLGMHDASSRLIADAGAIRTPTLLLAAGSDWVVHNSAQAEFFRRLSSDDKQMLLLPGFSHAIFHERERGQVSRAVRAFVERMLREPEEPASLLDADRAGFTKREYDRLCATLPRFSARRLSFEVQKRFLKTIPMLSAGVRLGWSAGFDSGRSLDHVYGDRAAGVTPLGRLIDRIYLNAIGWRGIRVRKQHLRTALLDAIRARRAAGRPVRIVDIAAGPGRYLLEVLAEVNDPDVSALLRDHNAAALRAGRELAAKLGVERATFEEADAFSYDALASMTPRPNVAVVSGLYELFPDNGKVIESLRGLAAALAPGGTLIYTNQPWHPQLEMIARVLINRDGKPWIMRRRTTEEMNELVRASGFDPVEMRIDDLGIFTVSVAEWNATSDSPRPEQGR